MSEYERCITVEFDVLREVLDETITRIDRSLVPLERASYIERVIANVKYRQERINALRSACDHHA